MKYMKRYVSVLLTLAIMLSCTLITMGSVSAAEGSRAYFDNSKYNWEKVYVYAYGTKVNAKWPGQLMEKVQMVFTLLIFRLHTNLRM